MTSVRGQGGGRGDVAGVSAHQLHQSDAVEGRLGFEVRTGDRAGGFVDSRRESERAFDVLDVVVDRLWHGDDGDRQAALPQSLLECPGSTKGSVAPDAEQDVAVVADQGIDHLIEVLGATRGAEHRAAATHGSDERVGREGDRRLGWNFRQAGVAVAEAEHVFAAVVVPQREHQRADDVVEAGADAAAGDDAGLRLTGREVQAGPRPGLLEARGHPSVADVLVDLRGLRRAEDSARVGDEARRLRGERGVMVGSAESAEVLVQLVSGHSKSISKLPTRLPS